MKNRNEVLARLKAVGHGAVADALIAAKSAEDRARVIEDAGLQLDIKGGLETAWTKKVTITADAGEEIEVVGSEPEQAMAEDPMDEDEGEKSAPAPRRQPSAAAMMGIYKGASDESRGKGPVIRSARERAVKHYTQAAAQGRINPKTRDQYVYIDGDQAELAGAWFRYAAFADNTATRDLYSAETKAADLRVIKAHGTNLPTLGGAFVPDEFSTQVIELLSKGGAFRRAVGSEAMASDVKLVSRVTADGEFVEVGENNAGTAEDAPTSDLVQLVARKIMFLTRVSNELLSDSPISVADVVARSIARAQGIYEDKRAITGAVGGNGLQQRVGANSTYDATLSTNWENYTSTKLQAWMGKLGDRASDGAVASIICSRQFYHSVLENVSMSAGGARPEDLIRGVGAPFPGADATYNGFPVYFTSLLPKSYTADQFDAYVGFFNEAAKLGEVNGGLNIAQSDQRYFELDQVAIRAINRIAINLHDVDNSDQPMVVALKA